MIAVATFGFWQLVYSLNNFRIYTQKKLFVSDQMNSNKQCKTVSSSIQPCVFSNWPPCAPFLLLSFFPTIQ